MARQVLKRLMALDDAGATPVRAGGGGAGARSLRHARRQRAARPLASTVTPAPAPSPRALAGPPTIGSSGLSAFSLRAGELSGSGPIGAKIRLVV